MDSVTAINIVRDSLRTNLKDPYIGAGATARLGNTWIFADEPSVGHKYPRIEIKKIDNPSTVLSIGPTYGEREFLYLNVWIYFKNGWKFTPVSTEYKNSQAVEYMQGAIKTLLKSMNIIGYFNK